MKQAYPLLRRPVLASGGAVLTAFIGMAGALPMPVVLGFCAFFSGTSIALSLSSRRADRIRAAQEARSLFLSTLGHEVRTPLHGMLGMTGLMLDTDLTPEQRTYVRAARESGEALSVLLEDLLAMADQAGGAELEIKATMTDVIRLVEGIGEIMAPRAWSAGLELAVAVTPGVSPGARIDAPRVRQILMTLVSNGLQRSEQGGVILTLSYEFDEETDGGCLIFEVSDRGPEFPDNTLGNPPETQTKPAAGLSLGLATCQRIAEAMRGSIHVDNTPDGGRVKFHLPVTDCRPSRKPRGVWPECLVVSPSPIVRRAVSRQLATLDRTAISTATPDEAARRLSQMRADNTPIGPVFIDAAGQASDVLAAGIKQITGTGESRLCCVLMLTPAERKNLAWIDAAGYDGYLMKPVRLRALRRRLEDEDPNRAASPGDAKATPAMEVPSIAPMRILLAEDNDINAALATALLTRGGHELVRACDGRQAVELALEADFDLILMDLHMPVLNGFEAAKQITRAQQADAPPIIAFSANSYDTDIQRCEAAGMSGHLPKPIDLADFHEMLVKVARQRKKREAA